MLDSSTIDPLVSKKVAELAKEKDSVYMDAPVSGGKTLCEASVVLFICSFNVQDELGFIDWAPVPSLGVILFLCGH